MAAGSEQITRAMRSLEALFLIGVDGVTEIWLVRHGDCYDEMDQAEDPPLSARGREQAKRLAGRVAAARPAAIYSSPYRRAMETARAVSDDIRIDPRLVEMPLEISEDGALHFEETGESAAARMRAAIDDIVARHEGGRVVVVSHAASIMACLTDTLRLEPGQLRMLPYYTSVSTLRVLGDRRMVGAVGDVAHLE